MAALTNLLLIEEGKCILIAAAIQYAGTGTIITQSRQKPIGRTEKRRLKT
jgi:hypothetical protein